MTDCIFCKILKGEIPSAKVWEDDDFYAFLDINPLNPGHTLLIPKKHEDYLFELGDPHYSEIFKTAKKLAHPLKKATGAKRIGLIVEGFLVPHVHLHLIPIHSGGEMNPSRAKRATPEELAEMSEKIKDAIKE